MRLDVRLIIPGPDAGTILLDDDGSLPRLAADGDADEASVVAVDRALRDRLGLAIPILESHPRRADVAEGEPVPTLATTEAATVSWQPPRGLAFRPLPDAVGDLAPSLRPRASEWLAELRVDSEPPRLRPRWSRRGWTARTGSWMAAAAASAGQPLTGEPQPFYLRGISALLRAPTNAGDLYLKAVFPPFQAEPLITRWLSNRHPAAVPRVLGLEPEQGWLLMADAGGTLIGELPDAERPGALAVGARTIVEIQRSVASDVDGLLALSAPRRPLAEIPGLMDAALGPDGLSIPGETIEADRRRRAVAATAAAVARVAGLGFPDTVAHGDFHPGNAVLADGQVVVIDWSDAAIGNPLVDLATWIAWSQDRPEEVEVAVDAWIDAWSAEVDADDLRKAIDDVQLIGAAYQVISYDGIIRALEPSTRYTMGTGGGSWLKAIESILGRRR